MSAVPIRLAGGITHVVFAKRSGVLGEKTLCGMDWRRQGQWPSVTEDGSPIEVDCMACIAEGPEA